jgi:hypothetical protein
MAQVRLSLKKLGLSPKGQTDLARLALEFMERQASAGVSATGAPHPPGVDLHDTGRLWRDVVLYSGSVRFQAPYSGVVNARYPFNNIAPQFHEEFLQRAAEIMRRELVAE